MRNDLETTRLPIGPEGRFDVAPQHLRLIQDMSCIATPVINGIDARLCIPVATHHADTLADITLPPMDHHTLVYHRGGAPAERLMARGQSQIALRNSVSLMSAEVDTAWHSRGKLAFTHLYLRGEFLKELALATAEIDHDGRVEHRELMLSDPELPAKVKRYVRLVESGSTSTIEMETHAVMIGMSLLRGYANLGARARRLSHRISPLPLWRLRRLEDFVDAHLDQPLRLADLAQVAGQSPHHFIRTMRAATGQSPHQWLTHKRIERARVLLARSDLPLIQVALECGFGTQQHFTTVLKQSTGLTPAAFRRLMAN
jgi:AraC family transcriptional regulator